jgi:hypothetical protein
MTPDTPVRYTGKIPQYQNIPLTIHSINGRVANCRFPDAGRPRGAAPPDFGITTWIPVDELKEICPGLPPPFPLSTETT